MVVDFPAPVGPRNPSTGPRSTANETWSTAVTPSNRLETPSTDRRGIPTSECVYRRSDANHTGPPSSSPPAVPGVRLQGLEKRDDGVPVRDGEGLEAVADARGFPAVALDGLLQGGGLSVMQERLGVAQIEQRLGAEIPGGRAAEADVGQLRSHVVEQQVGVGGELAVGERCHGARPGAQRRGVAGGAAGSRGKGAPARARPCPPGGGGGAPRNRTKSSARPSASRLISGSASGSTPGGMGLPPMFSSVGCSGSVTPISVGNAPALNSRNVGTRALRPNRPMRPARERPGRPRMPS